MSIALAFTLGAAVPASAQELADDASQPTVVGEVGGPSEMAPIKPSGSGAGPAVYIVQLDDSAVATYMGGTAGLAATSNQATGAKILDTNSAASQAYAKFLRNTQSEFVFECEIVLGVGGAWRDCGRDGVCPCRRTLTEGEPSTVDTKNRSGFPKKRKRRDDLPVEIVLDAGKRRPGQGPRVSVPS